MIIDNNKSYNNYNFFFLSIYPSIHMPTSIHRFKAISIVNLPRELEKDTTYRYHGKSFKLHRLPIPRAGQVLGLVGSNGTGKSTALKVYLMLLKFPILYINYIYTIIIVEISIIFI